MGYTRKTRDYWSIEQLTCCGWEEVTIGETWPEARQLLRDYRENQPEYPVRARKRREKIDS